MRSLAGRALGLLLVVSVAACGVHRPSGPTPANASTGQVVAPGAGAQTHAGSVAAPSSAAPETQTARSAPGAAGAPGVGASNGPGPPDASASAPGESSDAAQRANSTAGATAGQQGQEQTVPDELALPEPSTWLDASRELLYDAIWHTAMKVDRWFGSTEPDVAYAQASGSIAPAILWSQYYHTQTLLRFHADLPLPAINDNLHAFIGRLNPSEFIQENQPESGQLPDPFAPNPQDQTILGIQYTRPSAQGVRLDAGLGVPLSWPFDPYVKGGYVYALGDPLSGVLFWRQFIFYQNSQGGFGVTNRVDLQRIFGEYLLLSWTGSTTIAERSAGWGSYSTLDAIIAFPHRRAIDFQLEVDGSSRAPVQLHNYGFKIAYRRSIFRDWLVLEVRTGVAWPKDYVWQERTASFGIGAGVEMYFGTYEFQARAVTF
jgi:hypothetical protein